MVKISPSLEFERNYWEKKLSVIGVDEVGRGCLAGPVVAGAFCITPNHNLINGVTDSKLLTSSQRKKFYSVLQGNCQEFALGIASVSEINELGIVPATFLAMERALLQLSKVEIILVDGSLTPRFEKINPQLIKAIIKGDQLSYSIAAASIIAKVHRDNLMQILHHEFPEYAWNENKGYGTKKHLHGIQQFGITPHHRTLFCRKVLANKK